MTITKIATTVQTMASSQDRRIESPSENIGEKKLPETALLAACINMMIRTLPRALLKTLGLAGDIARLRQYLRLRHRRRP
jgi:hypothetical protein